MSIRPGSNVWPARSIRSASSGARSDGTRASIRSPSTTTATPVRASPTSVSMIRSGMRTIRSLMGGEDSCGRGHRRTARPFRPSGSPPDGLPDRSLRDPQAALRGLRYLERGSQRPPLRPPDGTPCGGARGDARRHPDRRTRGDRRPRPHELRRPDPRCRSAWGRRRPGRCRLVHGAGRRQDRPAPGRHHPGVRSLRTPRPRRPPSPWVVTVRSGSRSPARTRSGASPPAERSPSTRWPPRTASPRASRRPRTERSGTRSAVPTASVTSTAGACTR